MKPFTYAYRFIDIADGMTKLTTGVIWAGTWFVAGKMLEDSIAENWRSIAPGTAEIVYVIEVAPPVDP